ncbi:MAG TPA: hypothetical protein VF407_18115 [Polyangiaceae bacterium]
MALRRAVSSLVLVSAVGAIAASVGCSNNSSSKCQSLNTCDSQAVLKTYVNLTKDEMGQATIYACSADTCNTGTATTVPSTAGDTVNVTLNGSLTTSSTISSPIADKGYPISVTFELTQSAVKNGDVYKLYAMLNGTKVDGGIDGPVTFATETPNGAECTPVCQTAVVDNTK